MRTYDSKAKADNKPPTKKKASRKINTKIDPAMDVKDIEKVDKLEPTDETFNKIVEFASKGYSTRSIAYLMGVTQEHFEEFRYEHDERVSECLALGAIIDETECLTILRNAATSARSANFLTALQFYGKSKFGWAGTGTGTSKEQPKGIAFRVIDPVSVENDE